VRCVPSIGGLGLICFSHNSIHQTVGGRTAVTSTRSRDVCYTAFLDIQTIPKYLGSCSWLAQANDTGTAVYKTANLSIVWRYSEHCDSAVCRVQTYHHDRPTLCLHQNYFRISGYFLSQVTAEGTSRNSCKSITCTVHIGMIEQNDLAGILVYSFTFLTESMQKCN